MAGVCSKAEGNMRCMQAFRRFQWVPVRVEVELRKLQQQKPELGQLVPAPSLDKPANRTDRKGLLTEDNP